MTTQRIYVAGHRGMVGSAIVRRLQRLADEQDVVLDLQGLPEGVARLLEMAASPSTQAQAAPPRGR